MSLIHIGRNIFTVFVLFNFAATTIFIVEAVNAIPRSYIVEYEHNSGGSNYHHNAVNQELEQYNDLYKVKHVYSSPIFNGMSVTLNDNHTKQLQQHSAVSSIASTLAKSNDHHHPVFSQLRSHPVVKHIYPIYEVPRPQWKANQEDISLPYLGRDSQVNDIHSKLGLTGKDVLIGVLDSGVDYYHPALGGGFGEDHKIKLGKNLVSAEDDQENGVEPLGENDPYDPCRNNDAGHGTHVAGVIAGYYPEKNFVGIAPNASLGVFRIFGCEGGATEDTVIKAMEMAYKAGCKVINLSLGIENSWPEDAMSVVAERLSNQGVVVVGVAGNQGENGVYSQNSPATARSVISVASVDNSFVYSNVISFDFINDEYFSFATSTTTDGFPNGTIATITENGQVPFGCMSDTSITTNSAQGKILLVRRGACTFREKVEKAQSVGAIGVLFYDPNAQDKSVPIADTEGTDLPFAGIDSQLAGRLAERMTQESEGIQVIIPAEKQIVVPPRAGKISGFSSTGPNYELDLKPSITGIGGSVYSTLPLGVNDGWGVRSGTSMASPQVAGSAALLIEYQKLQQLNYTSHYIIEQLQNHGKLIAAEDGRLEHPVVQGAGLVQPYDAIVGKLHATPAQISFNDTASLTEYKTQTIILKNLKETPVSVTFDNIQTHSIESYANSSSYVPTQPAIRNGTVVVSLEFSTERLVIPPLTTAEVVVKVILPDPETIKYHYQMYGGFIAVQDSEQEDKPLVTIPYFGILGRLIDIPIFDKGYPYLTGSDEKKKTAEVDTHKPYIYDLRRKGAKKPAIYIRLLTGTAEIEIKVLNNKNATIGYMNGGPWTYNQRNTLANDDFDSSVVWDGKIKRLEDQGIDSEEAFPVKSGTYYLLVRALKHFGHSNNRNDWVEWKSQPIIVQTQDNADEKKEPN